MFAVPLSTAVTVPSLSTVTTSGSSEDQVNVAPLIVAPPASLATAAWDCVSPRLVKVSGPAGVTAMLAIDRETVTATALLVTPDADAVMFAEPSDTAVTVPSLSTVATPVSSEVQSNDTPLMLEPPESCASALSDSVAPIDESVTGPVGVTSMLEITCSTVIVTALEVTAPTLAVTVVSPTAIARNTPAADSSTTVSSAMDQVTGASGSRVP